MSTILSNEEADTGSGSVSGCGYHNAVTFTTVNVNAQTSLRWRIFKCKCLFLFKYLFNVIIFYIFVFTINIFTKQQTQKSLIKFRPMKKQQAGKDGKAKKRLKS